MAANDDTMALMVFKRLMYEAWDDLGEEPPPPSENGPPPPPPPPPPVPYPEKPGWIINLLAALVWDILSWHIDVGGAIETAIDWVLDRVNAVLGVANEALTKALQVASQLLELAASIPGMIADLLSSVWFSLGELWNTFTTWVSGLPDLVNALIDVALQWVRDAVDWLSSGIAQLFSWVSDFLTEILPTLAPVELVERLIRQAFGAWDDLLAFWSTWGRSLLEFFADPEGWVERRAEWLLDKISKILARLI